MAKRIAGICYIKCNGQQLEVAGDLEAPLAKVKRETVMGQAGPAGFKETALEPYVKVQALFLPTFPLDALRNSTDITVTAEFANGKVYTLSGGYLKGETPVKGVEGTVDLEFGGDDGDWQ